MSDLYQPRDEADVLRLVAEHPLAWVISGVPADLHATPLPLLAECDAEGRLTSLLGHFGGRNPQIAALAAAPDALILFQGPQGYVSPGLVDHPAWAPTWNYAVARFQVRIELLPELNDHALRELTGRMEAAVGGDWQVEAMGPRYDELSRRIVAFRAHVLSRRVTFKLGQDESASVFADIVRSHPDRRLAAWMRDAR